MRIAKINLGWLHIDICFHQDGVRKSWERWKLILQLQETKLAERKRIYAKTDGLCWFCGEEADTIDHFLPRKMSKPRRKLVRQLMGPNWKPEGGANLIPACGSCNNKKGGMLLDEFRVKRGGKDKNFRFFGERCLPLPVERFPILMALPTGLPVYRRETVL